ncbi:MULTISPECIES: prolipoprotein diacylglyceryl transferase [Carnobacterium]|jgi:phosphatidylglycerol:prolipoprotein diacylglycerol transferase|uniref:prolipoprotein diacylglyceryl transferase n=1 Tax=Carnobacterium TaxID=2747 RepID=UPI000C75DC6E|nr:prolipoprotein diacylglyceryl transferase [Carnobacterium maltaromaticum]AOA02728.1 prolipoprotein diacylglyceryl transferase [Carnobacterium maltaromaticum]MCI1819194.1 prolipoprotein diacylglyceryl transferase [Carnobacterium maltaromaticum]PLS36870.1 prolipoprotein diacylglyceryl transferase [Carnobacterium maltaromaticum]PLS37685.1 prolipoprotein diacylglyceryl transferase [Carnobacterium maltaromaticum]PLS39627.1 prolipoprotein diacylglyceryl transferase [Carnobacterium maltaromaticum]
MSLQLGAIDPIAFSLGGLSVHWYGVIIASAVLLAIFLGTNESEKRGIKGDDIIDMMLWALPISIIGARIYYVIFEWRYYIQHPAEIIAIWNGGIAIYGGLIAGGLTVYWFTKKRGLPFWLVLDIAAPSVIIAQAIGRWGNFVNQEAHGEATTKAFLEGLHIPDFIVNNMNIEGVYYQPTFLYESLWNVLGFILLLILRRRKNLLKRGEVALSYVLWYSFGRFFIEGLRTDSLMLAQTIRVSQLLSILLFVGAILLWIYRRKKYPENPYYLTGAEFAQKN